MACALSKSQVRLVLLLLSFEITIRPRSTAHTLTEIGHSDLRNTTICIEMPHYSCSTACFFSTSHQPSLAKHRHTCSTYDAQLKKKIYSGLTQLENKRKRDEEEAQAVSAQQAAADSPPVRCPLTLGKRSRSAYDNIRFSFRKRYLQ